MSGFELTTLVLIGTDCAGSCQFTIMTMTFQKNSTSVKYDMQLTFNIYSKGCLYDTQCKKMFHVEK
jgi:hypothetical protein